MTTEKYTQDFSDKYDMDASVYVFLQLGSAYTHNQAHRGHMSEKFTLDDTQKRYRAPSYWKH